MLWQMIGLFLFSSKYQLATQACSQFRCLRRIMDNFNVIWSLLFLQRAWNSFSYMLRCFEKLGNEWMDKSSFTLSLSATISVPLKLIIEVWIKNLRIYWPVFYVHFDKNVPVKCTYPQVYITMYTQVHRDSASSLSIKMYKLGQCKIILSIFLCNLWRFWII